MRRRGFVPNETPWVDAVINKAWDRIEKVAPPEAMPVLVPGEDAVFSEYGCGFYGCVLPTSRPDVVIKLTTDESEANFVSLMLGDPEFKSADLEGIVRYYGVVKLRGVKHKRRQVYAIWREAAMDVGFANDSWRKRVRWAERLVEFKQLSWFVWQYVKFPGKGWKKRLGGVLDLYDHALMVSSADVKSLKNPLKSSVALVQATYLAQEMSSTQTINVVGETLWELIEMGILLSDVHTGNVGKVIREDYGDDPIVVIIDPGQMVPLSPDIEIPNIQEA